MRAVILAAGYGRRMRPLTDATHKTLLRVAGKTIIGRIVDGLIENGIEETAVVTGYRAEELVKVTCEVRIPATAFTSSTTRVIGKPTTSTRWRWRSSNCRSTATFC